ncbi:MAG: IreB family regulatory phosphoprotein [Eubacteriales bacterium]|nr:IreB family regulatory phosphoprotein [Eubacteriales bacterium]
MLNQDTARFVIEKDNPVVRTTVSEVYAALKEKGYDPVNQIVGYIMSGDPTYITSHKNARALIVKIERDEILEEIVRNYLKVCDAAQQK